MLIEVTQKHIDAGLQGDSDSCAIALAHGGCIQVGRYQIRLQHYEWYMSDELMDWVKKFDTDKSLVGPITIKIASGMAVIHGGEIECQTLVKQKSFLNDTDTFQKLLLSS